MAGGTSSAAVGAAGSTTVTAKPQLASVTEKTEVCLAVFDRCCLPLLTGNRDRALEREIHDVEKRNGKKHIRNAFVAIS